MRVFLTGATGFIGTPLVHALLDRGDTCVVLSRGGHDRWQREGVRIVRADPIRAGPWQRELDGADAVINLAGERIVDPPRRWTTARRALLRRSRVEATRNLVAAMKQASHPPRQLLSGSAIGFYGPRGDEILAESSPAGSDFLASLALEWEAAAADARELARVVLLRTGIVLAVDGGALEPLLRVFRLGLGGPWGNGRQWWSWIHLADALGVILHALDQRLEGPVNVTAPNPVTVATFAAMLGRSLGRPAVIPTPALALRLALGEAADTLLASQRVTPDRVLAAGYAFRHPTLESAFGNLFP